MWLPAKKRSELLHHVLIRASRPSRLTIDPEVPRESRRVQRLAASVAQFVRELQRPARGLGERRADQHFVVVAKRHDVAAPDLDDDEQRATLLDLAIRHAGRAAEVRPPDLEPHQVLGVMRDRHLIGLGVADAHAAIDDLRH